MINRCFALRSHSQTQNTRLHSIAEWGSYLQHWNLPSTVHAFAWSQRGRTYINDVDLPTCCTCLVVNGKLFPYSNCEIRLPFYQHDISDNTKQHVSASPLTCSIAGALKVTQHETRKTSRRSMTRSAAWPGSQCPSRVLEEKEWVFSGCSEKITSCSIRWWCF